MRLLYITGRKPRSITFTIMFSLIALRWKFSWEEYTAHFAIKLPVRAIYSQPLWNVIFLYQEPTWSYWRVSACARWSGLTGCSLLRTSQTLTWGHAPPHTGTGKPRRSQHFPDRGEQLSSPGPAPGQSSSTKLRRKFPFLSPGCSESRDLVTVTDCRGTKYLLTRDWSRSTGVRNAPSFGIPS